MTSGGGPVGAACSSAGDCTSGICTNNVCVAAAANKAVGAACASSGECVSGVCANNVCAPTCTTLGYSCGNWTMGATSLYCGSCPSGQTCNSNGVCGAATANCTSHASKKCDSGNLYWFNSCNTREDIAQNCGNNPDTSTYRCYGNWLQQQTTVSDCVDGACTQDTEWTNKQDCSAGGGLCSNNACVTDSTPPVISDLKWDGSYIYTPKTNVSLTTNKPSSCRIADSNVGYDAMSLALNTTDTVHHSGTISVKNPGDYIYYILCKDSSGNINAIPGVVSFTYAAANSSPVNPVPTPTPVSSGPSDTTPPQILDLLPASDVASAQVTISCQTDEKATCRFGTKDAAYSSLKSAMTDDGAGTSHSSKITLPAIGSYSYYIRCRDSLGNKNTKSAKISFKYVAKMPGPAISGALPTGQVYQKQVALIVYADKTSTCHYSPADGDFDSMSGTFTTVDGLMQTAPVVLDKPGPYNYYVRCEDASGVKDDSSTVINFQFASSDQSQEAPVSETSPAKNDRDSSAGGGGSAKISCLQIKAGEKDGTCDNAADCVCDPDCGINGQPDDPDCQTTATAAGNNFPWLISILVGVVAVVIVIVLVFIFGRRKNGYDEQDELEDVGQ